MGLLMSTRTVSRSKVMGYKSKARGAGALITLPVMSKEEAWQGHSNLLLSATQGTAQPKWVHFLEMARKPPSSSRAR